MTHRTFCSFVYKAFLISKIQDLILECELGNVGFKFSNTLQKCSFLFYFFKFDFKASKITSLEGLPVDVDIYPPCWLNDYNSMTMKCKKILILKEENRSPCSHHGSRMFGDAYFGPMQIDTISQTAVLHRWWVNAQIYKWALHHIIYQNSLERKGKIPLTSLEREGEEESNY